MKKRFFGFAIVLLAILSTGFKYDTGAPEISTPFNLYLYDTLLLVSDSLSGLLVYSVADVAAPRFKVRIPLSGNRGVAMKDSIIYANSWGGILALRLVNDTNYEVTSVIKDDPYHNMMYEHGYNYYESGFGCGTNPVYGSANDSKGSSGAGGSYAIFAVIDSFLYYINNSSIVTMDISNPASPIKLSETYVGWDIETLFPTDQYLYIGGRNGMYVMDRSKPSQPISIGSISHFRARDPVVVQDSMAYVTLRADPWTSAVDELMVVNLATISNPKLVREIPMTTPYGLSIKDTLLYVAQGKTGWTLFGLSDPEKPTVLQEWSTPAARDFIWTGDQLFMMCFDGVRIYSVVDVRNPVMVGEIE